MPDPSRHAEGRNWVETILRKIPGFRGYLEKEYRRESDALARTHLAARLTEAKRRLDDLGRQLVDAVRLDDLPPLERLNTQLDTLLNKLRSDVQGYSGFFDFVRVDEAVLERVYEHDMALVDRVERFAAAVGDATAENAREALAELKRQGDDIAAHYAQRTAILAGLDRQP